MRFISTTIGATNFDVRNGMPIMGGKFPHLLIGTFSARHRSFEKIPVGADFAKTLKYNACPRNGSGAIGPCPDCGTMITPGMVRKVESELNGMKMSIPSADHGGVGMIYRGNAFFTAKTNRLMIAEERGAIHDRVALLLTVEGANVKVDFPTMENDEKTFHRSGYMLDSADHAVAGVHFVIVMKNDEIVASRDMGSFHETLTIKVGDDLYPSLAAVVREEIKAPEPAPQPVVEAPPEPEEEVEETEIAFEE